MSTVPEGQGPEERGVGGTRGVSGGWAKGGPTNGGQVLSLSDLEYFQATWNCLNYKMYVGIKYQLTILKISNSGFDIFVVLRLLGVK